ncbi:PBS lyase HEAT domain protein repeat-containing protein [Isosphaera pallida ATCC 43644]|uniref:PBS lyase HEAT domain protein repeat-containing protein n=1 Tax=Isosphaera pallida (strain ATCC 43644 / DSM 9630 / IS1B) TaxID=575540 RepID=E8R4Y5_ISOPI|nr:HEAT repeat domain-containing protein [Isosphaera pallida]ADV61731.1 PBS lyase HEAT domain protein repeat-containing protein [Isosphaera pallida ATCC 43644]
MALDCSATTHPTTPAQAVWSSHPAWLACLVMGLTIISSILSAPWPAVAQAPDDAVSRSPADAAVEAFAALPRPERFASAPRSFREVWQAIDYLVRIQKIDVARPYFDAFVEAQPSDEVLAAIQREFGTRTFLELTDVPEFAQRAEALTRKMLQASRRQRTDPTLLANAINLLSLSPAEAKLGMAKLREAKADAVAALAAAWRDAVDPLLRGRLAQALGFLDVEAVDPLIASLDAAGDPETRPWAEAAARALGRLGDTRAIPFLLGHADLPAALEAANDLARARRPSLDLSDPSAIIQAEAMKYLVGDVPLAIDESRLDPNETEVRLWAWTREELAWDDSNYPAANAAGQEGDLAANPADAQPAATDTQPVAAMLPRRLASLKLGMRLARLNLIRHEADPHAQGLVLVFALETAAFEAGDRAFLEPAPDMVQSTLTEAMAAGPALEAALTLALDHHQHAAAALAARGWGRIVDRDRLLADPRTSPLFRALTSPERRVRLEAARAFVELDPDRPFPGSNRVVSTLTPFLSEGSDEGAGPPPPRAFVFSVNLDRANSYARLLDTLGYAARGYDSGEEFVRAAYESSLVELLIVEPGPRGVVPIGSGTYDTVEILRNLKADARTAQVPVLLVGGLGMVDRIERLYGELHPRTAVIVGPGGPEDFAFQVERALKRLNARPLSAQERGLFARIATDAMARIASQPSSPFRTDLDKASVGLSRASRSAPTRASATTALAMTPTVPAQQRLLDLALDTELPVADRLEGAKALTRSIQRFGPLLTDGQERRLDAALGDESHPSLRAAYAAALGALTPDPVIVGRRMRLRHTPLGLKSSRESLTPSPSPDAPPSPSVQPGSDLP